MLGYVENTKTTEKQLSIDKRMVYLVIIDSFM